MTCSLRPLALVLLLAAAPGCTASWMPDWAYWDPWWEPNEPFETPIVRIERLQAMRDGMGSLTIEQRRARAAGLANDFANEKDPLVREEIIHTLAECGTPPAAPALRSALTDDDPYVRIAACQAFGVFGGEEGIRSLALAVKDEDHNVRLAALRALGNVKDPAAVQILAAAVHDRDTAISQRAMKSLESVTGKYYGNDPDAWLAYARGQSPAEKTRSIAETVGVDLLWFR
jgi:hypothetical protein